MRKTKIMIGILFIILVMLLFGISYYELIDIKSNVPEEIQNKCKIEKYKFMDRDIFVIKPNTRKINENVILYFHGGSYMAQASTSHWEFLTNLTNDTGSTIIMPDYPLAPKYNYEDVFKMVEPFYKSLIEKIDADKLIIMGDSAGGGLGLALEEKIAQENIKQPSKTILISPWLDVRLENKEIEQYEQKDKMLNRKTLKLAGVEYAKNDVDNYLVSPIEGDLSKLKNITIFIGTNDILNPDVKLLEQKAKKQGINIDVKEYEEASHIWIIDKSNTDRELVDKAYYEIINLV